MPFIPSFLHKRAQERTLAVETRSLQKKLEKDDSGVDLEKEIFYGMLNGADFTMRVSEAMLSP